MTGRDEQIAGPEERVVFVPERAKEANERCPSRMKIERRLFYSPRSAVSPEAALPRDADVTKLRARTA
jgi:hypothetical protein